MPTFCRPSRCHSAIANSLVSPAAVAASAQPIFRALKGDLDRFGQVWTGSGRFGQVRTSSVAAPSDPNFGQVRTGSDRFGQVRTKFMTNLSEPVQVQKPPEPVQTCPNLSKLNPIFPGVAPEVYYRTFIPPFLGGLNQWGGHRHSERTDNGSLLCKLVNI